MDQIRVFVTIIAAAAVVVGALAIGVPAPFLILGGLALAVVMAAIQTSTSQVAYAALGLLVLTITWNGLRVAGLALASAFLVVASVAVIAYIVRERPAIPLPGWLFGVGAGFALAFLVCLVFPPDRETLNLSLIDARENLNVFAPLLEAARRSDLATLAKLELVLVWIPVMIATVATTEKRILRLMDLWTLSAVVCAAVAVVDFGGLAIAPSDAGASRSAGLTIHPNYLALVCLLAIPTACLWLTRAGRWRSAGIAAVVLLLAASYASGSRAGTVSAILVLVACFVWMPPLRRTIGFVAPFAGMAVIALLLSTNAAEQAALQLRLNKGNFSAVGSDRSRARASEVALEQFSARPVAGVGLGAIQDAHNIYLQLLASGGLIAMASFVVFNVALLAGSRDARAGPQRDAAIAAAASVIAWLVHGVVDSQLADKYVYIVPGLLLALTCLAAKAPASQAAAHAAGRSLRAIPPRAREFSSAS